MLLELMEGLHRGSGAQWLFIECWLLALSSCPCFCVCICSQTPNHSAEDRLGETQSRGMMLLCCLVCIVLCRNFFLF